MWRERTGTELGVYADTVTHGVVQRFHWEFITGIKLHMTNIMSCLARLPGREGVREPAEHNKVESL